MGNQSAECGKWEILTKPANWDMRFKDMYGVEVVLRAEVAGAGHGESPGDVPLVGALLVRKEGVIPPSPFFTLPNPSPPRSSSSSSSSLSNTEVTSSRPPPVRLRNLVNFLRVRLGTKHALGEFGKRFPVLAGDVP